jgi:hypothetical protein
MEDGTSVPDASVTVADGPGPVPDIAALTDDSGNFALDGLAEGTYLLKALGASGETGETVVYIYDGVTATTEITLHREGLLMD